MDNEKHTSSSDAQLNAPRLWCTATQRGSHFPDFQSQVRLSISYAGGEAGLYITVERVPVAAPTPQVSVV